jgi:hypothetical protein
VPGAVVVLVEVGVVLVVVDVLVGEPPSEVPSLSPQPLTAANAGKAVAESTRAKSP